MVVKLSPVATVGSLPSGSRYVIEVPESWNGTLLLASHPVPVRAGEPPWRPDDPLVASLVASGYAVAGSANTIFWPLERVLADQPVLHDLAADILGAPRHTITFGLSIGGIIAAAGVQMFPERLSGALSICGNLAGAVGNHNRELDIAFVVKTLLAPGSDLQIARITNARANLVRAEAVLEEAQSTSEGRARLALAAAVGNIPGWYDPLSAQPAAEDVDRRQREQHAWFAEVGFLVFFLARKQVEMQAGGNPSWNTGVDYRELLANSINRDEVEALYRCAGLDLDGDLDRLASEERIDADPDALAYLERHIVFDGVLGVPVLALHTDGDGLVTPDHEQAYADVVRHAGHEDLLRQLYAHRGGHCTFTLAETLVALDVLIERIETQAWPSLDPERLNGLARRRPAEDQVLASGAPVEPGFFDYEPWDFPRPHDVRHAGCR